MDQIRKAFQAGADATEDDDVKKSFQAALEALQAELPGVENPSEPTNPVDPVVPPGHTTDLFSRVVPHLVLLKTDRYEPSLSDVEVVDDYASVTLKGKRIDAGDFDPLHHKLSAVATNPMEYGAVEVEGDWERAAGFEPVLILENKHLKLQVGCNYVSLYKGDNRIRHVETKDSSKRSIYWTPDSLGVFAGGKVLLTVDTSEQGFVGESKFVLGLAANDRGQSGDPVDFEFEFSWDQFYFEKELYDERNPDGPEVPTQPGTQNPGEILEPSTPQGMKSALPVGRPHWLGAWSGNVKDSVKKVVDDLKGQTALFIPYNIPDRDNGNYSAGGLETIEKYVRWIADIADGIGDAPAWVVLEPDALGLLSGLPEERKQVRWECLKTAVRTLSSLPNTEVFVDASMWVNPEEMADRLKQLGRISGFSVNVSGYYDNQTCANWADQVSRLAGIGYVIDTSRNGLGNPHPPAWCNVTDTKVGSSPTTVTGNMKCIAFLHLKVAGESDGKKINGYDNDGQRDRSDVPNAGERWPEYEAAIKSGDWEPFKKQYKVA